MHEYAVMVEGENSYPNLGLTVMTEEQANEFVRQANNAPGFKSFYVVRRTVTPWERR